MNQSFDVIIIGGGHAGCEAAHAAARLGCKTAMITLNRKRIGFMSCNPAMGGLAKGQLVKEIDALGGIMGRMTDRNAIQFRQLNESKGPAVRSSRAQCDKNRYASGMQEFLGTLPGLAILEDEVTRISLEGTQICGVELASGERLTSQCVIVTSGTFLKSVMHYGPEQVKGGRQGDRSAEGLSDALRDLGFRLRRLKTGTPPRLHKDSIDWTKTEPQPGDAIPKPFSFYERSDPFPFLPQIHCFITYTNTQTHEIIYENILSSPMYSGAISGVGPRYCPSIEDKVKRFQDKDRHQIFLEPEGLDVDEIYVNGISTSLPTSVQEKFVRSIEGLERAQFIKFGYAVEYDAIDARQLHRTFESKEVRGLYLAGQVNGTSGYEEAGAQGLMAGLNAALSCKGKSPFILGRHEAYMGVLADDLVLKGSDEPYRMFTSRAEYRLLLREDNADLRLAEIGLKAGLLSAEDHEKVEKKRAAISTCSNELLNKYNYPTAETNTWFVDQGLNAIKDRISAYQLLKRPEVSWNRLKELGHSFEHYSEEVREQVEIAIKYAGYIQRDLDLLATVQRSENTAIPGDLDFDLVPGLSNEIKSRLKETKPETLGQTARIQGVTPAAVANLMIFLKMRASAATRASNNA